MSQISDKSSKDSEMVTVDASAMVREVAGPRLLGDNTKALLARAARRLGFSYQRTRSIYYGEARIIRAEEWIRLNQEAQALRESAKARQEALHDLDLLARAASARIGEVAGPARVEGHATIEQGPEPRRSRPDLLKDY